MNIPLDEGMLLLPKTQDISHHDLAEELTNNDAYPHNCQKPIQVIETHSAWIFLTGDYAYKIKKPVNFGFLDFSTLYKRRFFCEQELYLNKKHAPQIYLKVVEVRRSDTGVHVDTMKGSIIDYAVKMNQFPRGSLLIDYVKRKQLEHHHIDDLVTLIASMHMSSRYSSEKTELGSPATIRRWVNESFSHVGLSQIDKVEMQELGYLRSWVEFQYMRLEEHFLARKHQGKIRECHGDLHLQNLVVIDNTILPFDRIEFNDELRWIDVMSEIAFLMMDLAYHHLHSLATRFVNQYLQITGDYHGLLVLRFYLVYRALVKAKVSTLRRQQLEESSQSFMPEVTAGKNYIRYAKNCTVIRPAKLIITHGLSGSGKSFYAQHLCEAIDAILIRSDIERKRLAGLACEEISGSSYNEGIYQSSHTTLTYHHMMKLAKEILSSGYSAILDATFLQEKHRASAKRIAQEMNASFIILHCIAPHEILRQRVAYRQNHEYDASEATINVLEAQILNAEPLIVDEEKFAIEINTISSKSVDANIQMITQRITSSEPTL